MLSIVVTILVAVLEKQSKLAAAITATMPLIIDLAFWIVYASADGERTEIHNSGQHSRQRFPCDRLPGGSLVGL